MKKFLKALESLQDINIPVLENIGPFAVACIQENINNAPGPNAPLTKKLKGNKDPLKDTGELRNSITYRIKGDTLEVGTPLKKAHGLHYGHTIVPKNAKKLAIPFTRKVAKWTDIKGVKGTIDMLVSQGWQIAWTKKSIIGIPPEGMKKSFGEPIKGSKKKRQVLYIRKDSVVVPEYPFMELKKKHKQELLDIAKQTISEAII